MARVPAVRSRRVAGAVAPKTRSRWVLLAATAAVAALVLLAPHPAAAQRQSGIQLGFDAVTILVSKDVGGDRWSISYDPGYIAVGIVYPQSGGTPQFVWCDWLDETDSDVFFSCYGSGSCGSGPCGEGAWTFIADVTLPQSFFELPIDEAARATALRSGPPPRGRRAKG